MTTFLNFPRSCGRFFLSLSLAGRIGLSISVFWILIAIFGAWIAPYGALDFGDGPIFGTWTAANPLGTDFLGRDLLSRILLGARYSIGLALVATVLASVCGTLLALISVVVGGWMDEGLSRVMDSLLILPSKILALLMVAIYGSSLPVLILTAAVVYMPGAYRIARSQALGLNEMEYVTVSRLNGESKLYIACRDILPNMIHPMMADFGLRFVYNVLMLSGLSFLGLGVQPPNADWGSLVRENLSGLASGAPAVLMPAVAIATLTIGANLFIDSLAIRKRSRAGS
ncbi:Glutathione transport system permease protein GsiD [Achromobacter mucicolens]|uniref:ABC transporter permease n=1 Tax=Achromobacter mucicolens TaxID=1389922 RepID=UPI001468AC84|nr:ABC transporter permease [Achromobacter mucicolens]CAB3851350.1 Glutathione transport system permease protein GsiD [Achromobacter mucicolens]